MTPLTRLPVLLAGLFFLTPLHAQVTTVTDFFQEHPGVHVFGNPFNRPVDPSDESPTFGALYGVPLSFGATPEESAWNHVNQIRPLLGDHWGSLVEDVKEHNGEVLVPIMGGRHAEPRFHAFRFNQQFGGLPVFRSGIGFLVRNESGHPLVVSGIDIKDLTGFAVGRAGQPAVTRAMLAHVVRMMDGESKSDAPGEPALKSVMEKSRRQLARHRLEVSDEELVIFAGANRQWAEPELAVSYLVTRGSAETYPEYEKYLIVSSVDSGEILFAETKICTVDVTGKVEGRVNGGLRATECETANVIAALPYIEVGVVGGNAVFADANGNFTIPHSGSGPVTVNSPLRGQWMELFDASLGFATPELNLSVSPPGPANFMHNPGDTEFGTANTTCYLEANVVRDYVLSYEPLFPFIYLQQSFNIRTNWDDACNAFYDGSSINFYRNSGGCFNTGFGDVVYHEYGHHLIEVSENGQGELGEGTGDVIGQLIQDDPILAWGFYGDCSDGLRNGDNTLQYPCSGGIHYCGQVLSGAIWDTRNELAITEPSTYRDLNASLFLGMLVARGQLLQFDPTIDSFITVLYLQMDDDDETINNGTPHYNEIAQGFGLHNLDAPTLELVYFDFPNGRPEFINSNGGVLFDVRVQPAGQSPVPGTGRLHVDRGNGFETVPMNEVTPAIYQANFPPSACGQVINYYFSVDATGGGTQMEPANAPLATHQGISGNSVRIGFADDFETDTGWFDLGDAFDGIWERGVPVGEGLRGDPPTDGDGSGQCFLTSNIFGNSDVDDGYVLLASPLLDATENPGEIAILSYRRWYSNNSGLAPESDVFVVEISNQSGQNLVTIETVGPSGPEVGGGWVEKSWRISDFVTPNDTVRVTFTASDYGEGSIVEAAVDAVKLRFVTCQPVPPVELEGSKLLDGVISGGSVADLGAADNLDLELEPNETGNPFKQKIDMVMQTTSPLEAPVALQLRVEAGMQGGPTGDVIQELHLLNYQTAQFEMVDVRAAADADLSVTAHATGDLNRFVQPLTREMTARLTWKSESFSGTPFSWTVDVDEAVWLVQ